MKLWARERQQAGPVQWKFKTHHQWSMSVLDNTGFLTKCGFKFFLLIYSRFRLPCMTPYHCMLKKDHVWMASIAIHRYFSVLSHVVAAPSSSTNGDFGEWNAFPGGQIPASAQSADISGNDLFGGMTVGPAAAPPAAPAPTPAPASGPASADLFDLMGPAQSLSSSQSLTLSMSSTQSMSTTVLPQSRSQVCMIALVSTWILFLNN